MAISDGAENRSRFRMEEEAGEHSYGDLGQIISLIVFLPLWLLDSFVFRYSTFLAPHVPLPVRLIAAGLTFTLAAFFIRSGHTALSDGSLRGGHLIKDGAFGRVRHPLYSGSLFFYGSLILVSLSLISLVVLAGIFAFYNVIAKYEEKLLLQKYGIEYQQYQQEVPRWIPRLRALKVA